MLFRSIHVSNRTQPDITIDILDSSAARVKLENRNILTLDDILTTVSDFTGKPLESLTVKGRETLKNLENQINAKIVGQRSQARAVAQVIVNNRLQLTNANRPQGVFLFVGPTGVGKTAMAKEIAIALYGSEKSLQKLDMGEFNSADCINKLLGAPAGYIGHEQSGVLIKALQQPGSVILLDEIEKAHKDVIKVLLNLFDTGIITSSKGIRCDSRANIIIMTSNLFSSKGAIERHIRKIGFSGGDAAGVTNADLCSALAVDGVFTEELLGRIDKILLFNELQPDDIREIIKLKLGETVERLLKKRITLKYDKETLLAYIYEKLEKGSSGVRGLQRLIETLIIQPLASALLECDSDRGMEVVFGEEFYLNGNVEIK